MSRASSFHTMAVLNFAFAIAAVVAAEKNQEKLGAWFAGVTLVFSGLCTIGLVSSCHKPKIAQSLLFSEGREGEKWHQSKWLTVSLLSASAMLDLIAAVRAQARTPFGDLSAWAGIATVVVAGILWAQARSSSGNTAEDANLVNAGLVNEV